MSRSNYFEKTLKDKFEEALEYIYSNEKTSITFCGLDISAIKNTTDPILMEQIVDIVDSLKLISDYKPLKNKTIKEKKSFVRNRKIVYNEEM